MEKTDQEIKSDYDRMFGQTRDVGTSMLRKSEIARRIKTKGGRTARVWKFGKEQSYVVFLKTN